MIEKKSHPEGEEKKGDLTKAAGLIPVDTYGGRVHIRWDESGSLTPNGQLPFFIEFLKTGGVFDRWVDYCPMKFTSPNAPIPRDLLGTILLSVLSGHTRYSHISEIRNDPVNAALLGMTKIVSEDAVRRGLRDNISEQAGTYWLRKTLLDTYVPILNEDWILDVDTTIKTLYGKQEGSVVGYNHHKPGRPSHTYHSYMIANLRLILDVDVHAGNEHASKHTAPGIWRLLLQLPRSCWPAFLRGDCNFGTDQIMAECEKLNLPYLFKLKKTKLVKDLVRHHMNKNNWQYVGHGWEGTESKLQLMSWEQQRRVVILRRPLKKEVLVRRKQKDTGQMSLDFGNVEESFKVYEYAVLVTSLDDDIGIITQHYRDRADSENNFDELKNHWGWSGFVTQDLKRTRMMAKIIALIYNWWTLFIRLITPHKHTEAITSRPMMLSAAGRQIKHANQTQITVCNTHAQSKTIYKKLAKISSFMKWVYVTAEQLPSIDRWCLILSRALFKYLKGRILKPPNLVLEII
jgi:hypothetical protein